MTELTDVLKREHKTAEKCHIRFKDSDDRKERDHFHCRCLYQGSGCRSSKLKYRITEYIILLFHHGTLIRTGITCKKIPCYMPDSACRWRIVIEAKIFGSYVKDF